SPVYNSGLLKNSIGKLSKMKFRAVREIEGTPQCVLCEKHPKTPYGYIAHLRLHHKTTLLANGIYLICMCGLRHCTDRDRKKHDKKCSGHKFSLHKLDE
ncbi:hypothetical protein PMAYCL1PPCAC_01635, partial [Pristionchus mayeri]